MLVLDSALPGMAYASGFLVVGGLCLVVFAFVFHNVPLPDLGERNFGVAALGTVGGVGVIAWIAHVRLGLAAWANRRVLVDEQGVTSYSRLNRRTFIPWTGVRHLRVTESEDSDGYSGRLVLYGDGARIVVDAGDVAGFIRLKELLLEHVPPDRVRHDLGGDLRRNP